MGLLDWSKGESADDPLPSGLIVACFDVLTIDGKTCTFSRKSKEGTKAYLLNNVKHDPQKDGTHQYKADILEFADAKEFLRGEIEKHKEAKPLFCIHGFTVHINGMFTQLAKAEVRFREECKYFPIPVLWATHGFFGQYYDDKRRAELAGIGLKRILINIAKLFDNAVPKSLLCHSMGNRVLCYAADGKTERNDKDPSPVNMYHKIKLGTTELKNAYTLANFDDIFLVAADIPQDLFNVCPKETNKILGIETVRYPLRDKKRMADNIRKMLKNKEGSDEKIGKIHVLHNKYDKALGLSAYALNATTRLGERGAMKNWKFFGWNDDGTLMRTWWSDAVTPDEMRSSYYLENLNCDLKKHTEDPLKKHGYQFEAWAIEYYNGVGNNEKKNK